MGSKGAVYIEHDSPMEGASRSLSWSRHHSNALSCIVLLRSSRHSNVSSAGKPSPVSLANVSDHAFVLGCDGSSQRNAVHSCGWLGTRPAGGGKTRLVSLHAGHQSQRVKRCRKCVPAVHTCGQRTKLLRGTTLDGQVRNFGRPQMWKGPAAKKPALATRMGWKPRGKDSFHNCGSWKPSEGCGVDERGAPIQHV